MSDRILVIEDEREIADLIELYLRDEDYTIYKFYTAKEALAFIAATRVDLALLDVMLPDMDGFTLCQQIRLQHRWPIIMLTARDEEIDKITGLTVGADDYMTKPFRPMELLARVKAQLRRYKRYNPATAQDCVTPDVLTHKELILYPKTHTCLLDGQQVALTPTEFTILKVLLERCGEVVSAEELFHAVWQDEYYSKSNNTVTVHIRHLREKLKDSVENPRYIKTVWGVGYRIET